jgi:hypothetical protein
MDAHFKLTRGLQQNEDYLEKTEFSEFELDIVYQVLSSLTYNEVTYPQWTEVIGGNPAIMHISNAMHTAEISFMTPRESDTAYVIIRFNDGPEQWFRMELNNYDRIMEILNTARG